MTPVLRTRDLIGHDVLDPSGAKLGTVGELLLDRRTGAVRFLEMDLGLLRRRHLLLPVHALDWGAGDAFVASRWTKAEVERLPGYDPAQPLTPELLDELARAHPRYYAEGEAPPLPAAGEARILPLSEAKDFKLPKEEPDVRGWNVFGADGERAGTVAHLLVDPAALKVRYLAVDVADDLFRLQEDRHVLVPLEFVELRERGQDAWVARLGAQEIARLPAYTGGAVDPLVEDRVEAAFRAAPAVPPAERSSGQEEEGFSPPAGGRVEAEG